MRCPDDGFQLQVETVGCARCGICQGCALAGVAFDELHPGMRALLAVEHDRESGAFAAERSCPGCGAVMAPRRIGELLAWLEVCEPCQLLWVEKQDARVMEALRGRMARAQAVAAMSPEERREVALAIAGEVGGQERGLGRLRWIRGLLQALRRLGF